jgi:hypothetical protein
MRIRGLTNVLAIGLLAGAAMAIAYDPPAENQDSRWRPWTGYEPAVQPSEGATPSDLAAGTCAAYENENFGGRRLVARDGAAMEYVGRAWNDRISSVACAPGCRLIAYHTIVFGGARANFAGARPTLGPVWNDRISALRMSCEGDPTAAAH